MGLARFLSALMSHEDFQEAYGAAARLSAGLNWKLYYVRPKCHMMGHVLNLACMVVVNPSTEEAPRVCPDEWCEPCLVASDDKLLV